MRTPAEVDEYIASLTPEARVELDRVLRVELAAKQARGWEADRVRFVREVLGAEPAGYQAEVLEGIGRAARYSVRGPHGLGKTSLSAWVVLHHAVVNELLERDWKAVTTASAWRQLEKYLWPEIRKWVARLRWDRVDGLEPWREGRELMNTSIRGRYGEAFAVASDDPALIEGAHADELLYVFDEAKVIPRGLWEAAEGAFSGGNPRVLAVSTPPPAREGVFYEIHARRPGYEEWVVRHVTKDEAIAAGRMSVEWAEARRRQWGEGDPRYISRVLGEFPEGSDVKLIPLSWIERAQDRWREWQDRGFGGEVDLLSCDVSDGGKDTTQMAARVELCRVRWVSEIRHADGMELSGRLLQAGRRYGCPVVVDAVGAGSPVVARMREVGGVEVVAYKGSGRTDATDVSGENGFLNMRSAVYWRMRELLDPMSGYEVCLPPDPELEEELVMPEWRPTSAGRIQVTPKEMVLKELGRSPDKADAVAMVLGYVPEVVLMREPPPVCLVADIEKGEAWRV